MSESQEARIQAIQSALDVVAREILRTISSQDISIAEMRKLAKFLFGCMNQKFEIRRRVQSRGPLEIDKVVEFASRAYEVWADVERRCATVKGTSHDD